MANPVFYIVSKWAVDIRSSLIYPCMILLFLRMIASLLSNLSTYVLFPLVLIFFFF